MENPIKMDDLGVPPIFGNIHIFSGILDWPLKVLRSTSPHIQLWGDDDTVFVEGAPAGMFKQKKLVNNGDKLPTSTGFSRISEPSTGLCVCVCELLEANLIGEPTPLLLPWNTQEAAPSGRQAESFELMRHLIKVQHVAMYGNVQKF